MKFFCRALILWVALALLCLLLATAAHDDTAPFWLSYTGWAYLLPLTVWATAWAASARAEHWTFRIGFWTVTMAGWMALLLLAQGHLERAEAYSRTNLWAAYALGALAGIWLASCSTRRGLVAGLREAMVGTAALAIASALFLWIYETRTRGIARQAEARWTEIGLPMDEFEKTLLPQQENAGSEVVRQIFHDLLGSHFYKDGTAAAAREPAPDPSNTALTALAVEALSLRPPPADHFDLPGEPMTRLAANAPALDEAYRKILAADGPAWACDPHEGFAMDVPSFLGVRKFAQLAVADANRHYAAGDEEGARRALMALQKLQPGLRQHPTLVSLMISIAVEALAARVESRLPATAESLPELAQEAANLRATFPKTLQLDAWTCLRRTRQASQSEEADVLGLHFLPQWAHRVLTQGYARRQLAICASNGAEHTALWRDPATFRLPDLGAAQDAAIAARRPCTWDGTWGRAMQRIQATLLVREQAALIREARAAFAEGRVIASRDSVVAPGLRWELIADPQKQTLATRLSHPPAWLSDSSLHITDEFWVLPLDGSVAWQFGPRSIVAAE